jgi:HEAT repeat protein
VRWLAVYEVGSVFNSVPDGYKNQAWQDLIQLTQDEDGEVQRFAAVAVGSAFSSVPVFSLVSDSHKNQAWQDLHRLTQNENKDVRSGAASAIGSAFSLLPDDCKDQAWQDLHKLTQDEDSYVRSLAASAIGSVFSSLTDGYKNRAWQDVHRLTQDEDYNVRGGAASAIGSVFNSIPDGCNGPTWQDLCRLIQDEDDYVRWNAASAIGSVFNLIPDDYKGQAWQKLIWIMQDENNDVEVQWCVAKMIGSVFNSVSDRYKDQAWQDLSRLTQEDDRGIRILANYSLGKISILKAIEAEDENDFKNGLKNALNYFEKSNRKEFCQNPAGFCHPFYRSFYAITFEKEKAEDEVQKYLTEAKSASGGSKNKEQLLETVENLANALSEVHNARKMGFGTIQSELNAYRRYCDRAVDLIGDAAEDAPGAARVLRRGLPIINERIKEVIREIQEKARAVCIETRGTGTPYEPLGMEVNKWAGELSDRDCLQNEKNVSRIIDILGEFCNLLLEGEKEYPCKIVEEIREDNELEDKLSGIPIVLSYLQPSIKSQLQNAVKPMTNKMRSDEQPSQKTDHNTTVIAESGSTVVLTQAETESGDVTVTHDAKVTKELQPEEHRIDHRKKTAIEIIAAFAVSVLVGIVSSRYLEDLTSTASTVIAFIAFIILLMIILTQNRDKSS